MQLPDGHYELYQIVPTYKRTWGEYWLNLHNLELYDKPTIHKKALPFVCGQLQTRPLTVEKLCVLSVRSHSTCKLPFQYTYTSGHWYYNAQSETLLQKFSDFFLLGLRKRS